jgi:hypothetical protein
LLSAAYDSLARRTRPHQQCLAVFVRGDVFALNQLFLQGLKRLVLQLKLRLQHPVRKSPFVAEQCSDLVKHFH